MLTTNSKPSLPTEGKPIAPTTVLRGHAAGVSATTFFPAGFPFLLTGDQAGECIIWELSLRRPHIRFVPDDLLEGVSAAAGRGGGSSGILSVAVFPASSSSRNFIIVVQSRRQLVYIFELFHDEGDVSSSNSDVSSSEEEGDIGTELRLVQMAPVHHFGFCGVASWINRQDVEDTVPLLSVAIPGDNDGTVAVKQLALVQDSKDTNASTAMLMVGEQTKVGQAMCMARLAPTTHDVERNGMSLLLVGYEGGHAVFFDTKANALVAIIRAFSDPCVACSFDEHKAVYDEATCTLSTSFVVGSAEGVLQCYTLNVRCSGDGGVAAQLLWEAKLPKGVGALSFDGRVVVAGGWDNHAVLFSATTGKLVTVLTEHNGAIQAVCVGNDEQLAKVIAPTAKRNGAGYGSPFATGASDGTVALWTFI